MLRASANDPYLFENVAARWDRHAHTPGHFFPSSLLLVVWFLLLLSCTGTSIGGYPSKWTSLPLLVVCCILDKLLEPIDHVRFAAVCKDWLGFSIHYNDAT